MLCRALFCMLLCRWAGRKAPPGSYRTHRSRKPRNETNLGGESLPMETGKPLYGGTGFPQRVQGKRGENHGESRTTTKVSLFRWLGCLEVEKTGTRKNVWT